MTGRVDVVVAAYNAAAYLHEALASAVAQGPEVASLTVVDDASTDATRDIASRFGEAVTLVALAENSGPPVARNRGVACGQAPFIAFLDADDRWRPAKLARQLAALDAAPDAAFALCGAVNFASPELPEAERAALAAVNPERGEWLTSALVVRRAAWQTIGAFAEDLRIGDSVDWLARARDYPHVVVDEVLVERRLHRSNLTRRESTTAGYLRLAHRQLLRRRAGAVR
ncbi:MAG: glycosyltransferase family 2 protein [Proteobacteria bacterium]|nr:glycosyltransferase family 2 protein [Pseudomonadota bacterium]